MVSVTALVGSNSRKLEMKCEMFDTETETTYNSIFRSGSINVTVHIALHLEA